MLCEQFSSLSMIYPSNRLKFNSMPLSTIELEYVDARILLRGLQLPLLPFVGLVLRVCCSLKEISSAPFMVTFVPL